LKLGKSYFTSNKELQEKFSLNPELFQTQVLVEGDAAYVRAVESTLTKLYDARNDPMSFNRYNGSQNGSPGGLTAAKTKVGVCGRTPEKMREDGIKGGNKCYELKRGAHGRSKELMSEQNKHAAKVSRQKYPNGTMSKEMKREAGLKSTSQRYTCVGCGRVMSPVSLGRHQKSSGHTGKTLFIQQLL